MRRKVRARNILFAAMILIFAAFSINIGFRLYAQEVRKNEVKKNNIIQKDENFNRPEPSRPIRPEIPGANRFRKDKVFLENADSLYKLKNNDTIERQIVKGNVKFRQAGMWMFCDSAYYFPELNSLDAFSNVRMEQGDTLFVYADKMFYDGDSQFARLKNGPTQKKVILINNDVTLTTDSLDYDLSFELGWYEKWGTIDDKVNTLTSLYGEYSPSTKIADFYHDVVLVNNRDGYTMLTDTLHYNTSTHIATIDSKTEIQGENDTIITTQAIYDTESGYAELLKRSMLIHRDSTGNITTLEGDSIIYDKKTRISRAFMFRDPLKHSLPMVITDTAQKTTLIGGYGIYNDSTKEALATIYPLLMEYSQGDTLFLRADTIKTFIITEMVPVKKKWSENYFPEIDGKPLIRKDSLSFWIDTKFFRLQPPMEWLPLRMLKAETAKYGNIISNNKEVETEELIINDNPSDNIGDIKDEESTDKIRDIEMMEMEPETSYFNESENILKSQEVPGIDLLYEVVEPQDTSTISVKNNIEMEPRDFHVALAYYRARFFKKDIQGVADSMVFVEQDSMLYMFRKPIIWSGERQVTGNRIDVHFNDSTADWAYLPESGLISEHIDEDFYNQITGKEILARFADETLKHLEVSGNVETIFLPQEEDSTFNRLVAAESSYLNIDMTDGKMDKLKMWPEVNGSVTPIFMVKRSQQFLQKFRWWESLRPKRSSYGGRIIWDDDLGEVPEELEAYFLSPSDFGEPKTFSPTRVVIPVSSLPVWDDQEALEENEDYMEEEEKSMKEMSEEIERTILENDHDIPDSLKKELEEDISEDIINKDTSDKNINIDININNENNNYVSPIPDSLPPISSESGQELENNE